MIAERLRNRIAFYAAAITIILQQLNSLPRTTVAEAPAPLVRVRHSFTDERAWHPDELFTGASGRTYVLVWSADELNSDEFTSARMLSN